jgi:hypothetical protein
LRKGQVVKFTAGPARAKFDDRLALGGRKDRVFHRGTLLSHLLRACRYSTLRRGAGSVKQRPRFVIFRPVCAGTGTLTE